MGQEGQEGVLSGLWGDTCLMLIPESTPLSCRGWEAPAQHSILLTLIVQGFPCEVSSVCFCFLNREVITFNSR